MRDWSDAKDYIKDARAHAQGACEALAHVVVQQCDGTEELTDARRRELSQCFQAMLELRDKI